MKYLNYSMNTIKPQAEKVYVIINGDAVNVYQVKGDGLIHFLHGRASVMNIMG